LGETKETVLLWGVPFKDAGERKEYEREYWDRPVNKARRQARGRNYYRSNRKEILDKLKGNVWRTRRILYNRKYYLRNKGKFLLRNRRPDVMEKQKKSTAKSKKKK